jgi:phosphohistidine phosphatase SixA
MLAVLKAVTLAAAVATSNDTTELKPDSLLKVLKQGGYTLVLRHARTDMTSVDEQGYSNSDRTTQRNLSGAGVADAKAIGRVMKAAGIPFGEILSSPMFRTMETAQMAFGEPTATPLLRAQQQTPEQRALFTQAAAPGTNRAIVTHHFLIETYVPGITPGAIGESEAVVIRTGSDGKIVRVGRFKLTDWAKLPGGTAATPAAFVGHGPGGGGQLTPPDASAGVTPFVWTATPATKIAGLYLHSFNSGDEAQMRTFIEKSLLVDANRPTEARLETWRSMFKEHGPITIVGTVSASATEATVRAKSRRGEFNVIVTVSPTDAERASSIRIVGQQ